MRFKKKQGWKRRLSDVPPLPELKDFERAGLDEMIAATKASSAGEVRLACAKDEIEISGMGKVRVWVYYWLLNDVRQGMIGWLPYGIGEEIRAAYQARLIKYFSDGVNPRTVLMTKPDGTTERLK